MKITLKNGIELHPIIATGERRMVHGVSRDTLSFVFPVEASLDDLDAVFTAKNCDSITIADNEGNGYIHHGYAVRAEISRKPVVVAQATEETAEVVEQRVIVSMAQRTYEETRLDALQAAVDMLCMDDMEV